MFSKVHSIGILGVEGYPVVVEADVSEGLPGFTMVGYLSGAVREAQDRVRTALKNSGFRLPARKITVNLSPADIRKEGTGFDLPIAVAVLAATGLVDQSILDTSVLVGELGLDGRIKPVSGILSIVAAARNAGKKRCFLPIPNVSEGQIIGNIDIIGVEDIRELAGMLNEPEQLSPAIRQEKTSFSEKDVYDVDFSEVNGQFLLKRATEIAVAGMHNIGRDWKNYGGETNSNHHAVPVPRGECRDIEDIQHLRPSSSGSAAAVQAAVSESAPHHQPAGFDRRRKNS